MPFHSRDDLRYYSFESIAGQRVKHATFTRKGGVSPSPWESLNVGGTVGDLRSRVLENRSRALRALEIPSETVFDSWQVHGATIEVVRQPRSVGGGLTKADGLLTQVPGLTLMMRFADCVPILLLDPSNQVVGLVHAGWKGTLLNVAGAAVGRMVDEFGSDPAAVIAGLGPSIGPDHYEVGEEIFLEAGRVFDGTLAEVFTRGGGRYYFDLWEANRIQLEAAGVRSVEISRICTACHLDEWYSHRGEGGTTGRFPAMIQCSG